jgi:hypothetical protein
LKIEREREEIKSEWKELLEGAAELRRLTRRKPKQKKEVKAPNA